VTGYPDCIPDVARWRREGVREKEIASRLGISTKTLWGRVSRWNRENPHDPLPRPAARPATPFYVQAAELRLKEGLKVKDIAARMGRSPSSVEQLLTKARAVGALPPRESLRDRGGRDTWEHYANKGATPPLGFVSTLLEPLTMEQVEFLLHSLRREDETLAHLLARILKEHLDAEQAQE
jgi:transposase